MHLSPLNCKQNPTAEMMNHQSKTSVVSSTCGSQKAPHVTKWSPLDGAHE